MSELRVDTEAYWRPRSFDELAREQGAGQPIDPDALFDADATDEEREAVMAALAELG